MSEKEKCPIWGAKAEFDPKIGDYDIVNSPRAGGKYKISGTAEAIAEGFADNEKVLLTDWLLEQRRLGVKLPEITSDTLEVIKKRRPLLVYERADNLLRYLEQKNELLGDVVKFETYAHTESNDELLAWTSSKKTSEVLTLVEYCAKQEWIEYQKLTPTNRSMPHEIMLIPDGYSRLAKLDGMNPDSDQCFVAMWFDESMDEAYSDGIAPAIRDAGYEPLKIDDKEFNGGITDEIIAEIKRSRFIIADFTHGEKGVRGGVYYEAGFAHGLNIPVIYTCQKNCMKGLHFDTSHLNHIVWKTPEELKEKLTNRISATIGDGPNK